MIELLRGRFGMEPYGFAFRLKNNPHDFGSYLSIELTFNDEIEQAVDYAYRLEGNWPRLWTDNQPIAPVLQ